MHREKLPSGGDRSGHPDLEEGPGGKVARDGAGWAEHVAEVTEAYNARPHQAVTVAPEDVETKPAATFRVLRDNAEKFEHNKNLTEGRKRRLEEAGAFRAATNAARSFQPPPTSLTYRSPVVHLSLLASSTLLRFQVCCSCRSNQNY